MTHELWTLSKGFLELLSSDLLNFILVFPCNAVPEFGFASVEVVDGIEVKVLLMPAKEGLPATDIEIWLIDPLDVLSKAMIKEGI